MRIGGLHFTGGHYLLIIAMYTVGHKTCHDTCPHLSQILFNFKLVLCHVRSNMQWRWLSGITTLDARSFHI